MPPKTARTIRFRKQISYDDDFDRFETKRDSIYSDKFERSTTFDYRRVCAHLQSEYGIIKGKHGLSLSQIHREKPKNKTIQSKPTSTSSRHFKKSISDVINLRKWVTALAIFLLCSTICNFWATLYLKYLNFEKEVAFNENSAKSLLYPALTFCNNGKYFRPMGSLDVLRSWAVDSRQYGLSNINDTGTKHIIALNKTWVDSNSQRSRKRRSFDFLTSKFSMKNKEKLQDLSIDHGGGRISRKYFYHQRRTKRAASIKNKKKPKGNRGKDLSFYAGRYTKFMDTWGWKLRLHDQEAFAKSGKSSHKDEKPNSHTEIDLVFAQFEGEKLSRKDFVKFYTREGVCYTFNSENLLMQRALKEMGQAHTQDIPRISYAVGPKFGLDLIFNVNNDNYVYDIMETNSNSGIKFVPHSPFEPPPIDSNYEVVGIGKRAYVTVSLFNETYLEAPWGHCDRQHEADYNTERNSKSDSKSRSVEYSKYSKLYCENECKRDLHLKFCGCVPYYYFNEYNSNSLKECHPLEVMNCSFELEKEIESKINTKCSMGRKQALCDPFKLRNGTCNTKNFCGNYCNCPNACNHRRFWALPALPCEKQALPALPKNRLIFNRIVQKSSYF